MKKILVVFIGILLFSFFAVTVRADAPPPPPTPWHRDLGDGLVFHYRPKYEHYSEGHFVWGTPTEFEAKGYPETGLYRDGELVYTVEEPFWGILYFSKDAMTFLEVEWWVPASGDPGIAARYREPTWPAVRFFRYGNLVHSYDVHDLVHNKSRLAFSVSHVQWDYQSERYYNRENNTLQITTRDGWIHVFCLRTGLIEHTERLSFFLRMQLQIDNNPQFWDNLLNHPIIGWAVVIFALLLSGFILFITTQFLCKIIGSKVLCANHYVWKKRYLYKIGNIITVNILLIAFIMFVFITSIHHTSRPSGISNISTSGFMAMFLSGIILISFNIIAIPKLKTVGSIVSFEDDHVKFTYRKNIIRTFKYSEIKDFGTFYKKTRFAGKEELIFLSRIDSAEPDNISDMYKSHRKSKDLVILQYHEDVLQFIKNKCTVV